MSASLANVILPNLNAEWRNGAFGAGSGILSSCRSLFWMPILYEFMCGGMIFPKCVFLRSIKEGRL